MDQFCFLTLSLLLIFISPITTAYASATFMLVNRCQYTIWPAIVSNTGSSDLSTSGFALQTGDSTKIQAPASWGGRIWARTHCTKESAGNFSCLTGDCGSGKVDCARGNPASSATLAEFRIDNGSVDYYDVSLVNGFNVPMLIVPLGSGRSCKTIGCTADLFWACPSELKMTDNGGEIVACKSACQAFGKEEYCCNDSSPCGPSSYSKVLKNACPQAHSYPMDDSTSIFSCVGSVYNITFCPATNASQAPSDLPKDARVIMRPGDQLTSNSQLLSEGGKFTLGFFTISETKLTYLGIWNTADEQKRKVWIANPNSPIDMIDSFGAQLAMDSTGTLRIFSGGQPIMNVAVLVLTNNNTIAVLKESGNFILMDSGMGNRTLWQSFDNPTSMLLPGMKLGFNLTTYLNWTMTSWLSPYIAASGAFTLSLERIQDSGQFVIRRHGEIYWTSGPWNNQSFPFLPNLSASSNRFFHKLNFISARDGLLFTFQTIGTSLSMLELSPDGEIIDHANGLHISPYQDFCYGNEKDNGCVASTTPMPICRSNKDKFQIKNVSFPRDDGYNDASSNISLSECMERCWNDCYCIGFANYYNGTGCKTWTGNNQSQLVESAQAEGKYVLVAGQSSQGQSPTGKSSKHGGRAWIWIIVAVSIVIALLLLGFAFYIKVKRRRAEEEKRLRDQYIHQLTESDSLQDVNEMEKTGRDGHGLKIFSFSSIMAATDDFSRENKLGEGGFGPVYKGKLLDGREIAVKQLSRTSGQGLLEFKNELILISKLQHTNLVRVLGCCIHEEEKLLIYEYMSNKSLDFFLFDEDKKEQLDWQKRFDIIEGVAQGLLYLHKYSRMRVIHRDLKASNVLLDENMNPKIADFGLAKIFKQNETEAKTNRVVGTYGYMAPEYAMGGTFSIKSDVFSFGVLILEIVSGRRNSCLYEFGDCSVNLVGYAWELWKSGETLELKDPALGESCDLKQILRSIHVGLLCLQERPKDRPTMSEFVSVLNNETMTLPAPKQPAFFTGRDALDSASGRNLPISVNELTISETEAR